MDLLGSYIVGIESISWRIQDEPLCLNPRLWIEVNLDIVDAIDLVIAFITIEWCYYTIIWMTLVGWW